MRKQKSLTPNRYQLLETSGSNKFVSTFSKKQATKGIVEKRDRKYNWVNYRWSVAFTLIIGILTYFVLDKLM